MIGAITFLFVSNGIGQEVWGKDQTESLRLLVKNFDEFIERFNFELSPDGKKIVDTAHVYLETVEGMPKISRKDAVSLLIDANLWERRPELCQMFVNQVVASKPYLLDFYQDEWFVQRPAIVKYKGKEHRIRLTLKIEVYPEVGSKWVIVGVDAPFLPGSQRKRDPDRLIAPSSDGTGFVALSHAFNDIDHFEEYLPREFGTDALTQLALAVKKGDVEYVRSQGEQEYHLMQIENWTVVVHFFNREDKNRGWLISELRELSDSDKELYLTEYLNIEK